MDIVFNFGMCIHSPGQSSFGLNGSRGHSGGFRVLCDRPERYFGIIESASACTSTKSGLRCVRRFRSVINPQEIGLDEANTSDLCLKMADTAPVPEDERRAAIMAKLAEAQAVRKKALVRSGPLVNSRVHTIAYLE